MFLMAPMECVLWVAVIQICVAASVTAIPNPAEIAQEHGYHGETHTVQTKDGYIVDMFRIWKPPLNGSRGPVFIMPGLACNAAIWILLGPGRALGYLLADQGYDVWLGSYRGNLFARKHVRYSDSDVDFWDFSLEEVGRYDIPAMIDRVLAETRRTQLLYIGHSMGGSSLIVLASFQPHFMTKVSHAYLLAPAAFLSRSSSYLVNRTVEVVVPFLRFGGLGPWGSGEIPLRSVGWRFTFKIICTNLGAICSFVEGLYTGGGTGQRNMTGWTSWTDYIPDSMSIKNVKHLQQLTVSKRRQFRRFDYGPDNEEEYGTSEPPNYEISRMTNPVSIYYGLNDMLVRYEDVLDLAELLRNRRLPYQVPYDGFNHADFFLGEQAKELLYDQILKDMEEDEKLQYASQGVSTNEGQYKVLITVLLVKCWMNFFLRG